MQTPSNENKKTKKKSTFGLDQTSRTKGQFRLNIYQKPVAALLSCLKFKKRKKEEK